MRKLFDRTPAEAEVILRCLKAVATAEDTLPFDPVHRATLDALCSHVLHVQLDPDGADDERIDGGPADALLSTEVARHESRA